MKHTKLLTHQWNKQEKGLQYNYISRRIKKRLYNQFWISSINTSTRNLSPNSYSNIIHLFKSNNIIINKKILTQLIQNEPIIYKRLITVSENL